MVDAPRDGNNVPGLVGASNSDPRVAIPIYANPTNHSLLVDNAVVSQDFNLNVAKGLVPGTTYFNKFGRNAAVATTSVPITSSGFYQTPTGPVSLEIISTATGDNGSGAGAREVTVIGLNSSWDEVTQTVTPGGTGAVALTTPLTRLYRAYVSQSGTYGSPTAGSHLGTLTIRTAGAGATWATIDLINSFPQGQTLIGAYSVPRGYSLYINEWSINTDSTKPGTVEFFTRSNIDDVTSPFTSIVRVRKTWENVANSVQESESNFLKIDELSDVGYLGFVSSTTTTVSANFSGYLVAN